MKIRYHKRFEKQFKKLIDSDKKKVINTIEKFVKNPDSKILKNHALRGKLKGMRSVSVSSDLRIIFEEFDGYTLVIFLDLGNHARIYK